MKFGLVNGSPRGVKSNTDKILNWITPDVEVEKVYAVKVNQHKESMEKLKNCDVLVIAFPLYTDSMPGVMKAFLEVMASQKDSFSDKQVVFIIHSGFTEAVHSRAVERYVRYFATKIMGMKLLGSVVMGGSEALQAAPKEFFTKKIKAFEVIKDNILEGQVFDEDALRIIAGTERFGKMTQLMLKMVSIGNFYWNRQLKANGAYERRNDTPYWE